MSLWLPTLPLFQKFDNIKTTKPGVSREPRTLYIVNTSNSDIFNDKKTTSTKKGIWVKGFKDFVIVNRSESSNHLIEKLSVRCHTLTPAPYLVHTRQPDLMKRSLSPTHLLAPPGGESLHQANRLWLFSYTAISFQHFSCQRLQMRTDPCPSSLRSLLFFLIAFPVWGGDFVNVSWSWVLTQSVWVLSYCDMSFVSKDTSWRSKVWGENNPAWIITATVLCHSSGCFINFEDLAVLILYEQKYTTAAVVMGGFFFFLFCKASNNMKLHAASSPLISPQLWHLWSVLFCSSQCNDEI